MKPVAIKIILVDDHKLFRRALKMLIGAFNMNVILYEAGNGKEALAIFATTPIDIALVDVQMPGMSGIELLKQIRVEGWKTKVIMLTQFDDKSLIAHALQLGASGFLVKGCDPKELQQVLVEVCAKGFYFDDRVLSAMSFSLAKGTTKGTLDITPREYQVLFLLKDGKSNKEVADNLGLTIRTVESYRKNLIKKTGSRNTVDLVSLAYRTGIINN